MFNVVYIKSGKHEHHSYPGARILQVISDLPLFITFLHVCSMLSVGGLDILPRLAHIPSW